jgi:hypothetical protein
MANWRGEFAGGVGSIFGSSFTTKSPDNKWIALVDSLHQIGLESVLEDLLILVWRCYILQKKVVGGNLESHKAEGKAYTHCSLKFNSLSSGQSY